MAGGVAIGTMLGLVVGLALSVYVARLEQQKLDSGVRRNRQYRLSLFGVPVILAVVGGLIGGAIAH